MFGIEPYGAVNKAGEHLFKGQSASWENIIHPCVGVEEFADCVDNKHCSADFAHQLLYFPRNEFFAGDFFHKGDHKNGEHRTGAYGRKKIEEESPRPNEETVAENIGAPEKHAVHAAQTALVECGKESSDTGKKRHIHVKIVGKVLDECIFFKQALLKNKGDVFNDKNNAVAGNTENNFRKHGVDVWIPVTEPRADRLPDIEHQDEHGARIAKKTDNSRKAYDVFEFVDVQNITEQTGEESSCPKGDDCEVQSDP